ncbi:MAG: Cytochrome oxidase complex assembly protein 1 [Anaerocolumna sp.]|jgi:hypothetical protein|nr:Cytochrome oxidase complex assembly protein 1 [Anaerocolumna sp.]
MYNENTSGHGEFAVIPDEIKGWNWGAFWFTWIWGIFNRSFVALLVFIPVLNLFVPFYLGAKGNELAWRNRIWESTEEFTSEQRAWSIGGWIIAILLIISIGYRMVQIDRTQEITSGITSQVLKIINENEEAGKVIGDNYEVIIEPALQTVVTNQGEYPTGHTIFIQGTGGIILVHTSLEKDYSIREITISPPNEGEKIVIDIVD